MNIVSLYGDLGFLKLNFDLYLWQVAILGHPHSCTLCCLFLMMSFHLSFDIRDVLDLLFIKDHPGGLLASETRGLNGDRWQNIMLDFFFWRLFNLVVFCLDL
jgi:hypothetical protein